MMGAPPADGAQLRLSFVAAEGAAGAAVDALPHEPVTVTLRQLSCGKSAHVFMLNGHGIKRGTADALKFTGVCSRLSAPGEVPPLWQLEVAPKHAGRPIHQEVRHFGAATGKQDDSDVDARQDAGRIEPGSGSREVPKDSGGGGRQEAAGEEEQEEGYGGASPEGEEGQYDNRSRALEDVGGALIGGPRGLGGPLLTQPSGLAAAADGEQRGEMRAGQVERGRGDSGHAGTRAAMNGGPSKGGHKRSASQPHADAPAGKQPHDSAAEPSPRHTLNRQQSAGRGNSGSMPLGDRGLAGLLNQQAGGLAAKDSEERAAGGSSGVIEGSSGPGVPVPTAPSGLAS